MSRVKRFDFARLPTKGKRTPAGFLRVDSNPTSVGIFTYRKRDGKVVRELRPPDEVFKADSLATLRGALVTDLHPSEMVKPSNARTHSVGFTNEDVRQDETDKTKVAASHTIIDERMIGAIERRDRVEVSCGYECDFDPTPGRFDGKDYGPHVTTGEQYDGVQRGIVYNHVAIGPRNWGRQGKDVKLKLDDKGELELGDDDAWEERTDEDDPKGSPQPPVGSDPSVAPRAPRGKPMETILIRIDGVDYQLPKDAAPHVAKAIADRDASITKLTGERDTAQGRADAAAKTLEDTKKKLDAAEDPKRLDTLVTERTKLVSRAQKVLGKDAKLDGLTVRQVHEAVLKKLDDKLDLKERSDDYVSARFDAAVENATDDTKRKARAALNDHADDDDSDDDDDREDADDDEDDDSVEPRAKAKRRADKDDGLEPWQRPLAINNER
jgi:hypothetical protein